MQAWQAERLGCFGDPPAYSGSKMMFNMRMSRVNITVPDDVAAQARAAGLNVSRVATAALVEELDRRAKTKALDAYLLQLENKLGSVSAHEQADAVAWADRVLAPTYLSITRDSDQRSP